MTVGSVDITYRGVFQKRLAGVITKDLVRAARIENKYGGTVQRYSDAPERNGIPAKQFAVLADDAPSLRVEMARYEPERVVAVCAMDDTLVKGIESWAWYGIQAINANLAEGGSLLVVSERDPEELLGWIPRMEFGWNLAVLPGRTSFGGLWVYNDDGTDLRTLGALSKVTGGLVALESLLSLVAASHDSARLEDHLRGGYESVTVERVAAGVGATRVDDTPVKPGWTEMPEGLSIPAVEVGRNNELFKKYTTRTARPVVDFGRCVRCQICYTVCPDECFSVTDLGHYAVDYGHCCGCGICAQACPVKGCIEMVDELAFESNGDLYGIYEADPAGYGRLLEEKLELAGGPVSHYGIF